MANFIKQFISYEGEGPNLGLKTLFLTYQNNEGSFGQSLIGSTPGVYINTEFIDNILFETIDNFSLEIKEFTTVEVPLVNFMMQNIEILSELKCFFFVRTEEEITDSNIRIISNLLEMNVKIKIEAEHFNFKDRLNLANSYSNLGFDVYLMPLFKEGVGELMMEYIDDVADKVRVMPPTQFLINMK